MSISSLTNLLKLMDHVSREPLLLGDTESSWPFTSRPLHVGRFYDDHLPLMNNMATSMCPYLQSQTRGQLEKRAQQLSNIGKDGFQVCIDVAQFKPNELTVKVIDDCVLVEGKHEERQDEYGYIQRHFVRRYKLPRGFEGDKVSSTLSSDGVLTIMVPKPQVTENANERVVQIQQTGPAHLCVKNNEEQKDQKDDAKGKGERGGDEKKK